jgi:hypothetical protein
MSYLRDAARDFAASIKALGFQVYVAERGEYGFITDDTETRVLSFSFTDGGRLSGNYGPPSRESGTGWCMDAVPSDLLTADHVRKALYAPAPAFAGKGWKRYTTVEQHLATYGNSSRYEKV